MAAATGNITDSSRGAEHALGENVVGHGSLGSGPEKIWKVVKLINERVPKVSLRSAVVHACYIGKTEGYETPLSGSWPAESEK